MPGTGSTNQHQLGAPVGGYQGEREVQDGSNRPDWQEEHESIYAPERTDVSTQDERVRGLNNEGREMVTPVRGAPERQPSTAPYYEVYEAYAQEAEEALAREEIPRSHAQQVREYFGSIQPDRSGPAEGE